LYLKTLLLTIALVPWIVFVGTPLLKFIIRLTSTRNHKR
jgi:type III secretory pathway component EscR